jgi:hypothetical protein
MRGLHEIDATVIDQAQTLARGLRQGQHCVGIVAAEFAHAVAHEHKRVEQAGGLDLGEMHALDDLEHGIGAFPGRARAPMLAWRGFTARHCIALG